MTRTWRASLRRRPWVALLFGGLALAVPVAAAPVPSAASRSQPARPGLAAALAAARSSDPEGFSRLAAARERLVAGEADPRRAARTTLALRSAGERGLWPLLAAVDGAIDQPATAEVEVEVEVGAVEALGSLRDARAVPTLAAWLERHRDDPRRVRAGVAAIGRIGDDEAVDTLLAAAASARAPADLPVLQGLGECRRAPIATFLARTLRGTTEPTRARIVVRALRDVAGARVWTTPVVAASGEGEAVRETAAEVLVDFALTCPPSLRSDVARALVAVDHPAGAVRIAEVRARGTPAEVAATRALTDAMDRITRFTRR
jgi:hypothetical protein